MADDIISRLRALPRVRVTKTRGKLFYYYYTGKDENGRAQYDALDRNPVKALAQYHEREGTRDAEPDTVAWLLEEFESAFLGDQAGDQGTRRPKVLALKTRREYRNQIPVLRRAFGRMRITEVAQHHVAAFLEQHPSPVSANRQIALLSRIYTWAIRRGWAVANPCTRVERNEEDSRERLVSDDEYVTRREIIGELGACLMDLGYMTGLRLGDICAIQISQPAETNERYAWLGGDAIYVKPQKTRKRVRRTLRFELDPALTAVVERLLALRATRPVASLYLVTTKDGGPLTLSGFESLWKRAAAKDGIEDFLWLDVRAKAATDAETAGHDPQILLGHSVRSTTERYLRGRRVTSVRGPLAPPVSKGGEVVPFPVKKDEE